MSDKISDELAKWLIAFVDYLALEKRLSENSQFSYCSDVKGFLCYLAEHDISLTLFNSDDVREYFEYRINEGTSSITIRHFYTSINNFVKFLRLEGVREDNPMNFIELSKRSLALPKVMSENLVSSFLSAPDLSTYIGLRDRAMFELLYACGLRVSELCQLKFEDMHLTDQYLIISGKGNKQRMIPMTDAACYWVDTYIKSGRTIKDPDNSSPYVFISNKVNDANVPHPMTRIAFWYRVKVYAKQIGMENAPSPHSFRHAFATHLLNHDADLRALQMLLGHSRLSTTQIYTHVALARMHQVYEKAHPKA